MMGDPIALSVFPPLVLFYKKRQQLQHVGNQAGQQKLQMTLAYCPPFIACLRRTFSVMRVSADLISPFSKLSMS